MGESTILTKMIEVREAQMHLEELLSMVFDGTEIILAQDNKPLARLTSVDSPAMPRVAGLHAGTVWLSDDFCRPLPEAFWAGNT